MRFGVADGCNGNHRHVQSIQKPKMFNKHKTTNATK